MRKNLYEQLKPHVREAIDDEAQNAKNIYAGKSAQRLIEEIKNLHYVTQLNFSQVIEINHIVFMHSDKSKCILLVEFFDYFDQPKSELI